MRTDRTKRIIFRLTCLCAMLMAGLFADENGCMAAPADSPASRIARVFSRRGKKKSVPDTVPITTDKANPAVLKAYDRKIKGERVGLVLSGGGAKGIAHVGVIKALEDNDIPIDYVAGTSMGAIVGSFYSMGWTPERMLELFTSKPFGYWSTGTIDPDYTYYFSKPRRTPQWVSVNVNPKDTTLDLANQILPTNLVSPIPMNMEFLMLYAPYTEQCRSDFNRLFVPFRCVTSDVYHKRKIVCSSGSLGDAVRASMSFPLVFKPIQLDGVLVYDGGIYDNFPVDVMEQDFDPDFIIGVSVSSPDRKPQANNVYSQLEDMIIQNNNYTVPEEKGIKIQVPVLDYGVLEFNAAKTIYDIGYKTGLEMVDSIKSRISTRRSLNEVESRRRAFASQTKDIEFDSVAVVGATPHQSRYLQYLFDPQRKKPFGLEQVQDAYYRAIAGGKLRNLLPQAKFGKNGKNTLLLEASVKQPWHIGVGGWITTSTHSQLYIDLGYHTLSLNSLDVDLSGWIGQTYLAGMLAAKFAIHSHIPSYMQLDFVASRQKYYDTELLFYQNSSPQFITDREVFFRLNYCWAIGRRARGFAGVGYGWLHDSYYPSLVGDVSNIKKDNTDYNTLAIRAGIESSTLDDDMYPSSGAAFHGDLMFNYEGNRYLPQGMKSDATERKWNPSASVEVDWKRYFQLPHKMALGVQAKGVATLMRLTENYTATLVHSPTFAPTPSTRNYFNPAFRSPNYLAGGLSPVWMPLNKLQLRGDFFVYSPIRHISSTPDGRARYDGWFRKVEFIGELAAVYNFSFASISIYGNYLTYPRSNWNFGINFGVLLQAPRLVR